MRGKLVALVIAVALVVSDVEAWAVTRYISTSGSDSNSCATSQSPGASAKRNFNGASGALACMSSSGGDTLIVQNGTYTESLSDWVSGTAGNPNTIQAENSRQAIIRPPNFNVGLGFYSTSSAVRQYVTVRGLVVDMDDQTGTHKAAELFALSGPTTQPLAIIFDDVELKNGNNHALRWGHGSGHQFINGSIHDFHAVNYAPGLVGVYWNADDCIFRGNQVFAMTNTNNEDAFAMSIFTSDGQSPNNAVVEENVFFNIGDGVSVGNGINSTGGTNSKIRRNIIYEGAGNLLNGIIFNGSVTGTEVYNNTIYGASGTAITASGSGNSGNIARNNLLFNNGGTVSGAGWTSSHNTSTDPSFVDAANANFALQAGSTAIDAGTDVSLGFNGSAPDTGVHETVIHASCVVADATPTVINITYIDNVNPPLLPASSITGFTARENAAAKTVSSVSRVGDNQINVTVSAAFTSGTTIDYSYSTGTGNVTDSALIGNTKNQRLNGITNQSCTNSVGGSPSFVISQAAFRFHGLRGTEAAPIVKPDGTTTENTHIMIVPGGKVRLRLALTCTAADCPAEGFFLRYSPNAGAYTVVPDAFAADNIAFCGTAPDPDIPANGATTTNQLSTGGAFVAGAVVRTSNAIPTVDMTLDGKTEIEYCLALDSDVAAVGTFDFRVYKQDGTALNTYSQTPRATVIGMAAGSGL